MARRPAPERKKASKPAAKATVKAKGKVELGYNAGDNYKARLTRGLLGVGLGEGYIVEILNYRTKRVLRRELFDSHDEARKDIRRVRDDINKMSTEEFQSKYLQPPA